ncbi:MAG: major capsid protein [Pseudomonadota bacterium]
MLTNMQVFNQYIMPAVIETLAQMVEKFNAASNGAIRLTTEGFTGDFYQESFFASLHTAQRRVDRYASNDAVAATDLSQLKKSSVKVAGGFGPIRFEPSQLTWLQKPTAEGVEVISRNMAEAMFQDMLNTAIASLVAAIEAQGAATVVDGGTAALSHNLINSSHALFGDSSSAIAAQIMDGISYHNLIDVALTNGNRLFVAGNVLVVDILNRPVVVTDAPALRAGGDQKVVSAVQDAAIVHDAGDLITNVETTNGNQRIETTMQTDYTFGLGLKGYTWDEVNGGKSPTDAELALGSNWDKVATSIKHTAGVLAITDI